MTESAQQPELYSAILRVANLENSVAWYERVLDLKPLYRDFRYRLVELLGSKGQRIMLREASAGRAVVPSSLHSAYVVFTTADADAMHDRLEASGEEVSKVQDFPGVRLFWLFDPDRHPLCILQFVIDWGS